MDRNFKRIAVNGDRQLWRFEKQAPDEQWQTYFRGQVYMRLPDGSTKKTPEDPIFTTEKQGRNWLAGNE